YSQNISVSPVAINNENTGYSLAELFDVAGLDGSIEPYSVPYKTVDFYTKSKTIRAIVIEGNNPPSIGEIFEPVNPEAEADSTRMLLGYAIVALNITTQEISAVTKGTVGIVGEQNPKLPPLQPNGYTIFYIANYRIIPNAGGADKVSNMAAAYNLSVIPQPAQQRPPLYISDVAEQLLEIAEPIKKGETPRFTLSPEIATKYEKTPCAELNFGNGATLRENLDEIAGIVHCISRVKNNVVTFDELGGSAEVDYDGLGGPVSIKSNANIEKYASHLDTNVDNLMNAQDPLQGAVSDPFVGMFRTVRAETTQTDMRTTANNCLIKTDFEINQPTGLYVWYNGTEYDILPFLYEKKEYDLLSTNEGVYPYAKAYALYYVQGQKNIYGLTFRTSDPLEAGNAFGKRAIENILTIVTGENVDWTDDITGAGILNYAFRVEYISAVRGRVRQAKKDVQELNALSAIPFNQSAPRLSSVNYGERIKGEMAMMSEPTITYCFKTQALSAVTGAVGKVYKDGGARYYVSSVNYTIWRDYVMAELTLSKNFNQLGRFIAVNNSFRQFEIDDNSQEERIVYEDYAVFSETLPETVPTDSLSNGTELLNPFVQIFAANSSAQNYEVTMAELTTYDADDNEIGSFLLPTQTLAFGNSLLFNFAFPDNYSAGEYLTAQDGYKLTRLARYGDPIYGEAKYLGFALNCAPRLNSGVTVQSFGDTIPLDKEQYRAVSVARTPVNAPLIINKSSRDAPNVTYQLHHVTDSGLIFGEYLTRINRLVRAFEPLPAYVVPLPIELNEISPEEPTAEFWGNTSATLTLDTPNGSYTLTGYKPYVALDESGAYMTVFVSGSFPDSELPYEVKSWGVYICENPGERARFLVGKNGALELFYIYLTHQIPLSADE
ncbi:MAG: hypothetical protein IJY04_06195, partial [Clostridia bacterium]|nr:hypothetical protein [Clostridia bacterium]